MSRAFDGTKTDVNATYLRAAHNAVYDTLPAITYAAWVYPTAFQPATGTDCNMMMCKGLVAGGPGMDFTDNPITLNGFFADGGVEPNTIATTSLPLNQWSHVAITYDSTISFPVVRIFVNGVELAYSNQDTGAQ